MLVGYARTSTVEQVAGFESQLAVLKDQGCTKVFQEQVSSVARREQLELAIDWCREGDTLIVTKLDRLARSVMHLNELVARLESKKVNLRIIGLGLDTGTPTGRLMLNLLGSIGQFEREVMLERQREGIQRAKGLGRYKGRTATAMAKTSEVVALAGAGKTREAIADELGISLASVYRALAKAKEGGAMATVET
jgi:DNA invertase Pin-like site-specific DNA recombinase